jgi:ribonuclease HI/IMP dehydrogenase/GMP reductase
LERQFPELTVHIDGASLGNPGRAGAGISFRDSSGEEVEALSVPLGEATNNVAEYRALILALEGARRLGVRRLDVFSDSELLVKQFHGQYRVKTPHLRPYYDQVQTLRSDFDSLTLTHVSREKNRRADELARQAAKGEGAGRGATPAKTSAGRSSNTRQHVTGRTLPDNGPLSGPGSAGSITDGEALSLNEVALLPVWSEILPGKVNTQVSVSGEIRLSLPFLINLTSTPKAAPLAAVTALRGGMALLRTGRAPGGLAEVVEKVKSYRPEDNDDADDGRDACLDSGGRPRVGLVLHPDDDPEGHLDELLRAGLDLLVVEASLGHGVKLVDTVRRLKESRPQLPLIAGDVTDCEGLKKVFQAGADGVKVGAPYLLGMKVPLFSAIHECARIAAGHDGFLLADVGTTELMTASSRIARALGAGADLSVVTLKPEGEEWKPHMLTEGLDNVVEDVRMIMSCCGAGSIAEFHRKARFVRA